MTYDSENSPTRSADRITVIGTGAIGSAVATVLLENGRRVTVWNRKRSRLDTLVGRGATASDDVDAAVRGSDLTLVCLTDYQASSEVFDRLRPPVPTGTRAPTVVMLTTGTPEEATAMSTTMGSLGLRFVDAGVQTAPGDVGTDRAVFLYSGSQDGFTEHQTTLDLLGSATWLGQDPAAAAIWDLALFGLWYDAQLGLLRAFDMLPAGADALQAFASAAERQLQHVVDSTAATAGEVIDGDYPRGPASLEEHLPVLSQLRAARQRNRLGLGGIDLAEQITADLIDRGHGAAGLTALFEHRSA